ncbi:DUF3667 domain-containing protein [Gellertiella hungarica]|uniref:DUF3667 domain-containing protein n=1 Tax=Gellertiella hungarica TaxID=1572859 RepID=A0A7W6NL90_9HYPH|nr:DUF3667 domain-containing protein [Gellertiella hungarica]MBB4065678.1 hypothetical protein [Gellertiella hungarica]
MFQPLRITPCQHDRHGRFCSKCGLETDPPRLTFSAMAMEFVASWLQKGFRQTAFGLLLAPGHQIRAYLSENRNLLVKPVNYLLILAAFHYWVLGLYGERGGGIDPAALGLSGPDASDAAAVHMARWLVEHFYQIALLQAVLSALLIRYVFYRREGWSLPEYTIAMTYIMAENLLIQSLVDLLFTPFHRVPPSGLHYAVGATYTIFAIGQFLGARHPRQWLRVALAYLTATLSGVGLLVLGMLLWQSWSGPL